MATRFFWICGLLGCSSQGRQCNVCQAGYHNTGIVCTRCLEMNGFQVVVYVGLPPLILLGFFYALVYAQRKCASLSYSYMTVQIIALVGGQMDWGTRNGYERFSCSPCFA